MRDSAAPFQDAYRLGGSSAANRPSRNSILRRVRIAGTLLRLSARDQTDKEHDGDQQRGSQTLQAF